MKRKRVRRLMVFNRDRRLVGILSLDDLAVKIRDEIVSGNTLGGCGPARRAKALIRKGNIVAGKTSKRGMRREAQQEETQPAEERGERLATVRAIASGGKSTGVVAGATEQTPAEPPAGVVMPPAPPGESAPEAVQKTRAVADAMIELGENADPNQVAEVIKVKTGVVLESSEVATIQATMRGNAKIPPGPDQPPPEDARRNPSVAPSEGQPMDTSTKEPRQERLRETALLRSTADRKQLPLEPVRKLNASFSGRCL